MLQSAIYMGLPFALETAPEDAAGRVFAIVAFELPKPAVGLDLGESEGGKMVDDGRCVEEEAEGMAVVLACVFEETWIEAPFA